MQQGDDARRPAAALAEMQAVIFDLDGVLTDTARVHAQAWKLLFDDVLAEHARRTGEPFVPFDAEADYQRHVDGKPRLDGIQCMLAARGIELPFGAPGDALHKDTVCGLAARKNHYFLQRLQEEGVTAFPSSVALVRALQARGVRTAVVSASRNCQAVLQAAGLRELFAVRVDGNDAAELRLAGKPDPALFLEAAARLGVAPAQAAVVEDATAGVEAGRRGGFGLVVGVNRGGEPGRLLAAGADVEVGDLGELAAAEALPDALAHFDAIRAELAAGRPAVFLDYDGTLTPIVADPDRAVLAASMRETLHRLAARVPVAIVTGRDLRKIRQLVGLEELVYAASHGFDIEGTGEAPLRHQQGTEFLPALDAAEAMLREATAAIPAARVERKRFAITVHYRQVPAGHRAELEAVVDRVVKAHGELRKALGKKIFELQPAVDWHKGKALLWLLRRLGLDGDDVVVLFIGDDVTDEDAFACLRERGRAVGIVVQDEPAPSAARFALADPQAVKRFLARLCASLEAAG